MLSTNRSRLILACLACGCLIGVAVNRAAADYPDEVRHDRPAAYWRFDDSSTEHDAPAQADSGDRQARYRGQVKNTPGVPGIGGLAASFAQPGDHIWVAPHPAFDGNTLSVEFWFQSTQVFPDHYWPGSGTFLSKGTPDDASSDWVLIAGCSPDGSPGRVVAGSGARPGHDVTLYSPRPLNDGHWHHIVWTRAVDGDNRLYVDGEPVAATNDGGGTISNERPITVGGDPILGGRDLRGSIDEVALFDHVLEPARVAAHFQAAGMAGLALFDRRIAATWENRCLHCHSGEEPKGGLDLSTRAALMAGGDSGAAIEPGRPEQSLLVRLLRHDEEPTMPAGSDPLPADTIAAIEQWIAAGAPYTRDLRAVGGAGRDFWSFQPLARSEPPAIKDATAGPIDRFVLAALAEQQAQLPPEADRQTLIRRLSFDLLGLPPTPAEIEAFCADRRSNAYELLVDRLLASPHFGERWGQHWLDVARYADSAGYEGDEDRINVYYYRDFVIQALNDDLPFNQFVRWQVAGDELRPQDPQAQAATGFLAVGPALISDNGTPAEFEQYHYDQLDDMVSTIGSAFLGLTVGCARCHDHKFDPLPTRDYYRLTTVLGTFKRVHQAAKSGQAVSAADVDATRQPVSRLLLTDSGPAPQPGFLLSRGDPQKKLEPVSPGFLAVLTADGSSDPWLKPRPADAVTTGQRTALADWLTDVDRGAGRLLARVIVNRIWQHHFGDGLVRTPNDFGVQGDRPIHPALLDWLAGQLIDGGWRLKPLHKQILLSAAYRQQVSSPAGLAQIDPAARAFFRRPQRLDAESLRDAILAASGQLDRAQFGPPIKPYLPPEALAGRIRDNLPRPDHDGPEQWRRSIYLFVKRSLPTPLLETFDAPRPIASCGRRSQSTVPTQALALLNDPFVRNQARLFAERCRSTVANDLPGQIGYAYQAALGRSPRAEELQRASAFVAAQPGERGLVDLCHVLLGLNEFVFVD